MAAIGSDHQPADRGSAARRLWQRPALVTDLPVAVLFVAGWITVLNAPSHLTVGLLFVAVVVAHVGTRPRLLARVRRSLAGRGRAHWIVNWIAFVAAAVMTVSGIVQWAGVRAMMPVHSTSSYLVLLAVGVHVWQRRRPLVARLRRRRRPASPGGPA